MQQGSGEGEGGHQQQGDAHENDAEPHQLAERQAVLLRDAVAVVGMQQSKVAFAVGDAERDARNADHGGDDRVHSEFSFAKFFRFSIAQKRGAVKTGRDWTE